MASGEARASFWSCRAKISPSLVTSTHVQGIMLLLFLAISSTVVHAHMPNSRCVAAETIRPAQEYQLLLSGLITGQASYSPCFQRAPPHTGVWWLVTGDGTLFNLTICSPLRTALDVDIFVGVHIDNNCRPGYTCSHEGCTQLECVLSSDQDNALRSSLDFCTHGVVWQTEREKEYQIVMYPKADTTGRLLIKVNGYGCDGLNTGHAVDECGVCGGDGFSCGYRGCDGVVGSGKKVDGCGVCGGDNKTCVTGCDNKPYSNLINDICGVCGGNGSTCLGCDGVPESDPAKRKVFDACGVCGGDNSTCVDCKGVPYGPFIPDVCGVCGGNGTSCLDCAGCPNGKAKYDDCGVCDGDNSTCYGCDGVKHSGLTYDLCGVCGGNNSCLEDCDENIPLSRYDACGVCNGDNSSCTCVVYENFTVPEMDCRLVQFSLGNIVQQIDVLLATLQEIRTAALSSYALARSRRAVDVESSDNIILRYIGEEVLDSNDFLRSCVNYYATALNTFIDGDVAPAAGVIVS